MRSQRGRGREEEEEEEKRKRKRRKEEEVEEERPKREEDIHIHPPVASHLQLTRVYRPSHVGERKRRATADQDNARQGQVRAEQKKKKHPALP